MESIAYEELESSRRIDVGEVMDDYPRCSRCGWPIDNRSKLFSVRRSYLYPGALCTDCANTLMEEFGLEENKIDINDGSADNGLP
jgi:hypothetical protein